MNHATRRVRARLRAAATTTILTLTILVCLMSIGAAISTAAAQYSILDNATGGDCTLIGAWDQYSRTCTLAGDLTSGLSIGSHGITIDGNGHSLTGSEAYGVYVEGVNRATIRNLQTHGFSYGIFLSFSTDNVIRFNTITDAYSEGIGVWGASNNDITGNYIARSGEDGIGLVFAVMNNRIRGNTLDSNTWGIWFAGAGTGNAAYDNIFTGTQVHVDGSGGPGIFSMAAPAAGNYWADWSGPDANADGYVDSPRVTAVGQDNLPWMTANAWCGQPRLGLSVSSAYWGSYADFTARALSVGVDIHSNGGDAIDTLLVGAPATNGVTLLTPLPEKIGNINQGNSWIGQLKYHVPQGVNSFRVTSFATAGDICGGSFSYPGPYAGA